MDIFEVAHLHWVWSRLQSRELRTCATLPTADVYKFPYFPLWRNSNHFVENYQEFFPHQWIWQTTVYVRSCQTHLWKGQEEIEWKAQKCSSRCREAAAENLGVVVTTVVIPFVHGVTQPFKESWSPWTSEWSRRKKAADCPCVKDDNPGVVNRLRCSGSGKAHIGQTGRTACLQVREHAAYVTTCHFRTQSAWFCQS